MTQVAVREASRPNVNAHSHQHLFSPIAAQKSPTTQEGTTQQGQANTKGQASVQILEFSPLPDQDRRYYSEEGHPSKNAINAYLRKTVALKAGFQSKVKNMVFPETQGERPKSLQALQTSSLLNEESRTAVSDYINAYGTDSPSMTKKTPLVDSDIQMTKLTIAECVKSKEIGRVQAYAKIIEEYSENQILVRHEGILLLERIHPGHSAWPNIYESVWGIKPSMEVVANAVHRHVANQEILSGYKDQSNQEDPRRVSFSDANQYRVIEDLDKRRALELSQLPTYKRITDKEVNDKEDDDNEEEYVMSPSIHAKPLLQASTAIVPTTPKGNTPTGNLKSDPDATPVIDQQGVEQGKQAPALEHGLKTPPTANLGEVSTETTDQQKRRTESPWTKTLAEQHPNQDNSSSEESSLTQEGSSPDSSSKSEASDSHQTRHHVRSKKEARAARKREKKEKDHHDKQSDRSKSRKDF